MHEKFELRTSSFRRAGNLATLQTTKPCRDQGFFCRSRKAQNMQDAHDLSEPIVHSTLVLHAHRSLQPQSTASMCTSDQQASRHLLAWRLATGKEYSDSARRTGLSAREPHTSRSKYRSAGQSTATIPELAQNFQPLQSASSSPSAPEHVPTSSTRIQARCNQRKSFLW